MTNDQLAEIRELASKATPGPWRQISGKLRPYFKSRITEVSAADAPVCSWAGFDDSNREYRQHVANAAYIAALDPTTVLGMVAEIERLRGSLTSLAECCEGEAEIFKSLVGIHTHAECDGEVFESLASIAREALKEQPCKA